MYVYDEERAEQQFCVVGFYSVRSLCMKNIPSIEELLARLLNAESGDAPS